jgi:glycosyltransferase involved in cell wall biosynthesis
MLRRMFMSPAEPTPFLSIVVPFFNEVENAQEMVSEVVRVFADYPRAWELICVDEGSENGTGSALETTTAVSGSRIRVLQLRRNFGQTATLQAGIDASQGELTATLDGDWQNDPADLPRIVFSIQFLTTGVLAELLAGIYFDSPRAYSYVMAPTSRLGAPSDTLASDPDLEIPVARGIVLPGNSPRGNLDARPQGSGHQGPGDTGFGNG